MATASNHKIEGSQILLMILATFGFGFMMYFSGGNKIINTADSKRSVLRELCEHGATTTGESISRDRGYSYFDTKRLREFRPSDTFIRYTSANETIEIRTDEWGSASGNKISVRYLPSNPKTAYYTNKADILQSMNDEIRDYTIHLVFVWAIVLLPAAFGLFVVLASLSPDNGVVVLLEFILVTGASISLYLYLVW